MKTYTVIGMWDDTNVVYAEVVEAKDEHAAMAHVVATNGYPPDLILGAIEGSHKLVAACEDSGKAAWAVDLGTCFECSKESR